MAAPSPTINDTAIFTVNYITVSSDFRDAVITKNLAIVAVKTNHEINKCLHYENCNWFIFPSYGIDVSASDITMCQTNWPGTIQCSRTDFQQTDSFPVPAGLQLTNGYGSISVNDDDSFILK